MENLLDGSKECYCEVVGFKRKGLDAKVQITNEHATLDDCILHCGVSMSITT